MVAVSLPALIHGFQPLFSFDVNAITHRDITQRAVLRKTAEVCRDIAASEGRVFSLTIDDSLSTEMVQKACSSTGDSSGSLLSTVMFTTSIANMYLSNAKVDVIFALSEEHHFDDETFVGGRDVITAGVSAVKASVKLENFVAGRWTLGSVCHTLQLCTVMLLCLSCSHRLMGLSQSSALCFVIDTTGSMSDDIAEAKRVSFDIIDSKRGTEQEPSVYILVPFNDPGFGPLIMTTNADIFKDNINKLSADGGGDIPELCLSGLQVTFMLTDVTSARRRRRSLLDVSSRSMSQSDAQLYRDLAQASGGQAIEVTKSDLTVATSVIKDSSASAVSSSQASGPLASITTAGNLRRLSLNTDNQTGSWEIRVNSNDPYAVKVTGGNASLLVSVTGSDTVKVTEVTLFDSSGPTESVGSGNFLVTFRGVPAGGFVVRVRGEDSGSTSRATPGSFQRQASTQIRTSSISVTTQFNNTNIEPGSTVSVPFSVTTTTNGLVNDSAVGTFTVRANNDRSYASSSPSTVTIAAGDGGKANGTVTLTAPASAASGTDVTLTIEAENTADSDINYTVLRLSVVAKVTDSTRPVCQVGSSTMCPSSSSLCTSSRWEFMANLTDGINGTGIESVSIRQGNGTLNTSTVAGAGGENITVVTYNASCCAQKAELTAVDKVGNVGTCVAQARASTTAAPVTTAAAATTSTGGHTHSMSHYLWICVVVSLLWKQPG
ncbi:von Willebrand factor A domain-containing protein 7 [Liparis tanakae]|uniref:von Willebrand factor A domain-containing protein 7 n=1 Tax=Liparis tanakae TaxID=230148 RepID=A0A4Z2GKY7_9TELE|nr:von Willebrand factor A domain-containing protein 7 [Liparis tanakae]